MYTKEQAPTFFFVDWKSLLLRSGEMSVRWALVLLLYILDFQRHTIVNRSALLLVAVSYTPSRLQQVEEKDQ